MPRNNRIIHVIETLEMGGAENLVIQLSNYQKKTGHDVAIICLFHEGVLADKARGNSINVYCCERTGNTRIQAIKALRTLIKNLRPNILHTHNAVAHYYGIIASLLVPIDLKINTRHGMAENLKGRRREFIYKATMGITDYAVFVCDEARALFVAQNIVPRNKAKTINNGIELDQYKERNEFSKARLLSELSLPHGSILIGSVGRLNKVKNHEMLLTAFADLVRTNHSAFDACLGHRRPFVLVVGDGENRENLENLVSILGIKERVKFLGNRSDVPEILAGLDIFCLPSHSEGFSLALTEAAATGLPSIATNVGGNSEIITHGLTGLLTPSNDRDAFRDALALLVSDENSRIQMGKKSFEWAKNRASIESMNNQYIALLEH